MSSIRDALAAEGSAPLIFMGGTNPGPKWRDRLAAQVSQSFRWFDPVVNEWTQEAQETEVAVRAEADVLLYVITPYQEGFYSFFEMTEDAVRSEKPVVVAFIPTYDDKAFSELQWASMMAGKRLLERHGAVVCSTMEELIDWFGKYNPAAPDSKLLDTQALVRKANNIDRPATQQPNVQDKQVKVEQPVTEQAPAKAEAGTAAADTPTPTPEQSDGNTAVDDAAPKLGTESYSDDETQLHLNVSTEGIIDFLSSLFSKKTKVGNKDKGNGAPDAERASTKKYMWAEGVRKELMATYGNREWVTAHLSETQVEAGKLAGELQLKGRLPTDPASVLLGARRIAKDQVSRVKPKIDDYQKRLRELERKVEAEYSRTNDLESTAAFAKAEASKLTPPFPSGTKGPIWYGDIYPIITVSPTGVARFKWEHANRKLTDGTLPALTVDKVLAAAKALDENLAIQWELEEQLEYCGLDMTEGVWRKLTYNDWLDDDTHMALTSEEGSPMGYENMGREYIYFISEIAVDVVRWMQRACSKSA